MKAYPQALMGAAALLMGSVPSCYADADTLARAVPTARAEQAIRLAQIDSSADTETRARTEAARQKLRPLVTELQTFVADEAERLPPNQRLTRLDGLVARYRALTPDVAGTPLAQTHANMLKLLLDMRAELEANAEPGSTAAHGGTDGPHPDFDWLGQQAVSALTNPLQRETFRASLARGIDFNVAVSAIEPTPSGWLVQLSGRPGVPGTPGQGFFCRVEGGDAASLAVLRTVMPPYGIVRVSAPGAETVLLQANPMMARIVFAPCQVALVSDRPNPPRSGAPSSFARAPVPPSRAAEQAVAPSPLDLRCTTEPSRFAPQRAMARRLRQAWAIPEPLRYDPSLMLTFAVTLNFDAQLQAPPRLLRSQSRQATPEQLTAAADAADRAIRETAPFPELGPSAGGTMQIDMTPCD